MSSQGGPGKAFGVGAIGCLSVFLLLGLCVAATGGTVHADAGGVFLLLLIGGVLGLIVWAIYSKGRRDAMRPTWPRTGTPKSVDELVGEVERDFREGRIDRQEYERRIKRAWGGQP